jgi:hypothetical protein
MDYPAYTSYEKIFIVHRFQMALCRGCRHAVDALLTKDIVGGFIEFIEIRVYHVSKGVQNDIKVSIIPYQVGGGRPHYAS